MSVSPNALLAAQSAKAGPHYYQALQAKDGFVNQAHPLFRSHPAGGSFQDLMTTHPGGHQDPAGFPTPLESFLVREPTTQQYSSAVNELLRQVSYPGNSMHPTVPKRYSALSTNAVTGSLVVATTLQADGTFNSCISYWLLLRSLSPNYLGQWF